MQQPQNDSELPSSDRLPWVRKALMCLSTNETCTYGVKCIYCHSPNELLWATKQEMSMNKEVRRRKKGVCIMYRSGGVCSMGDSCSFAHINDEEEALKVEESNAARLKREQEKRMIRHERRTRRLEEKRLMKEEKRKRRQQAIGVTDGESKIYDGITNDIKTGSLRDRNFEAWIRALVYSSALYDSNKTIFERAVQIFVSWKDRFAEDEEILNRYIIFVT